MKNIIMTLVIFFTMNTLKADEIEVQKQQFAIDSKVSLGFSDGAFNIIFVRKTENGLVVSGLPFLHSEQVNNVKDLIRDFEITLEQTKRDKVFSLMRSFPGVSNPESNIGFNAACEENSNEGKCTFVGLVYDSNGNEITLD